MGSEPTRVEGSTKRPGQAAWQKVYERLSARDEAALEPHDLEALSDAAWWLCRVEESLAARQNAYLAYLRAGNKRRAGYNAWMLSTEYEFIGKPAASAGWLKKAQRHLHEEPECVEQGYLAFSEAEIALAKGEIEKALAVAQRMTDIARRCQSPDLSAMGAQMQGRILMSAGRRSEGMTLLDEAMCDVVAGQLSELVTGWIYCIAVGACYEIGDLRRATEWNDAAMQWCDSLPAGTPFHGLCRVHHAELVALGGQWEHANAEADRACAELMAYHPQMAAESFYVAGEIRRRMGDLEAAEQSFMRAHELGREPQPGLALLRLSQGKVQAAAAALRSSLTSGGLNPLAKARLLAAWVEVALALGDVNDAEEAAAELEAMSDCFGAGLFEAMASAARGALYLAMGKASESVVQLRQARGLWLDHGFEYEAAQSRILLAKASRSTGDLESADLELRAARSVFARLDSADELRRVEELLRSEELPAGLTAREAEVLVLVAAGKKNRAIAAELVISEHTVARHLNSIFAKLGVSSRAAATAFAYTHNLARKGL